MIDRSRVGHCRPSLSPVLPRRFSEPTGADARRATTGLLGDINKARDITADKVTFAAAQRIDSLVMDPDSGDQRRRTDYAGTVWYGGRPQIVGRHPLPGTNAQISASFWLPDSHVYDAGASGGVQVQPTAAVQGGLATSTGGNLMLLDVGAALAPNPETSGTMLVYITVSAVASLPFGVAYRVIVICAPEVLRTPAA
jgi:hypothetical protein